LAAVLLSSLRSSSALFHWGLHDGRGNLLHADHSGSGPVEEPGKETHNADFTSVHLHHLIGGEVSPPKALTTQYIPADGRRHTRKMLPSSTRPRLTPVEELREHLVSDRLRKDRFPLASSCNFCGKCALLDSAEDVALEKGQLGGTVPLFAMYPPEQSMHSPEWKHYFREYDDRRDLQNCTKCQGCTGMINELETMPVEFKGSKLTPTPGRSRSIVYRVSSEKARHGVSIGKVLCLPFSKEVRGEKEKVEPCDDKFRNFLQEKQYPIIEAAAHISAECGLDAVAPHSWIENVTAIMPGTGYVIEAEMLLQDVVKGVSLNSLHRHLSDLDGEKLLASINSTTVVLSAIYDLLLTSEDRHNDNVLIDSRGRMSLIDNDKALGLEHGQPQSLFFPTSMYMWYNIMGRGFVNSHGELPKSNPNYNLMLDYRCHVKSVNGAEDNTFTLGTNYPRKVKQCLQRMDSLSAPELLSTYGLPDMESAELLKGRVSDMLHEGFEAALEKAIPFCKRLPWTKPCCKWQGTNTRNHEKCADPQWNPDEWATENCVKVGNNWKELHNKENWAYVPVSKHQPSINQHALKI